MNRKRLIAAIGEARAKLALLEHHLEQDEDEQALTVLDEVEKAWTEAMVEVRS